MLTSAMPVARRRSYSAASFALSSALVASSRDDDAGRAGQDPCKRQALLLAGGQQLFPVVRRIRAHPRVQPAEPSCTSSSSSSNWSSVSSVAWLG